MASIPIDQIPENTPGSFESINAYELFHIFNETVLTYNDNVYGKFTGTDSWSKFDESLKTAPQDWTYRSLNVKIKKNKFGYRTEEFENVSWPHSIVLFGCSNVYGVGLSDEHTIAEQITRKTGIPVINLATPGTSPIFNVHNSMMLREKYPTPLAVVYVWPDIYRNFVHGKDSKRFHAGSWRLFKNVEDVELQAYKKYYEAWLQIEQAPKLQGLLLQLQARQLWYGTSTKVFECSFTPDLPGVVSLNLPCSQEVKNKIATLRNNYFMDFARDCIHPGIVSAENAADIIINNLKL